MSHTVIRLVLYAVFFDKVTVYSSAAVRRSDRNFSLQNVAVLTIISNVCNVKTVA